MRIVAVSARPLGPVPLPEVSGLAVGRNRDGGMAVAAISDREATIARAALDAGSQNLDWQAQSLLSVTGTRLPRNDPQLEAIAIDGVEGVLLVQESPCRAEYVDARRRRVLAHLTLDIPAGSGDAALRHSWDDPDSSHAEGVVLLKDGHLLIVKEKGPTALLEFGPAGGPPLGFGADGRLAAGQAWLEPGVAGTEPEICLVLLAAWFPTAPMQAICPDLSGAAVGPAGNLLLLSDKGRCIAVVPARGPAPDVFAGEFEALAVLRIEGIGENPEGIAVLPDLDVLVACDRREPHDNLFLIPRQAWQPAELCSPAGGSATPAPYPRIGCSGLGRPR